MKKVKYTFLLILVKAVFLTSNGQNLVPNPSFETKSKLSANDISEGRVPDWSNISGSNGGSSDAFSTKSGNVGNKLPDNKRGNTFPRTGDVITGFSDMAFGNAYNEALQAKLITPLIAGVTYYCAYYIKRAELTRRATNGKCMHITSTPITDITLTTPQILNLNVITEHSNWTLIEGYYTAVGGEEYVTIGGCYTPSSSSYLEVDMTPSSADDFSYYYVEDVVIEATSILPVNNFISLTGTLLDDNKTKLNWVVNNKEKQDQLIILKSSNQKNWIPIANINYESEDQNEFVDQEITTNTSFYKLKYISNSGNNGYSNTIIIQSGYNDDILIHFDSHNLIINSSNSELKSINLNMYDIGGRLLKKVVFDTNSRSEQIPTPSNTYFYNLITNDKMYRGKIPKIK